MASAAKGKASANLGDSVVKIFVRSVADNYTSPWTKRPQSSSTGSGLCIDRAARRVLTNSHVVQDAVSVRVRKHGDPTRYPAVVLCASPQCDLALLEVRSDAFWEGVPEITLTEEVPALDSDVLTLGYPVGGDNISVTRGVVSRIDLMDYTFSPVGGERLPVIQVDAAINPGNSGGPVLSPTGKAVGVAFAGLQNSSNIGYVIPGCVAMFFLRGFATAGRFDGLCSLGVRMQNTQNQALRELYGLAGVVDASASEARASSTGPGGVLVVAVAPLSPAATAGLKAGDVLLSIDDIPIADDGTVPFRTGSGEGVDAGERIGFDFLVTRKAIGEPVSVKIASASSGQDGSDDKSSIRSLLLTAAPIPKLVPRTRGVDAKPSYLVVGGLVFVPLSLPWLEQRFSRNIGEASPQLLQHLTAFMEEEEQEVVVLAKVLAAEVNYGFEDLSCMPLLEFGAYSAGGPKLGGEDESMTKVRSLKHLRALTLSVRTGYLRFKLAGSMEIVLDAASCCEDAAAILRQHAIPSECSEDLWQTTPAQPASRL